MPHTVSDDDRSGGFYHAVAWFEQIDIGREATFLFC
jgi:hypothetical protein